MEATLRASSVGLRLPQGVCHDGQVDITAVEVASDDQDVRFSIALPGSADAAACETPTGTIPLTQGGRVASVLLGGGAQSAFRVLQTASGCFAFGDYDPQDGVHFRLSFVTPCARSETPEGVTFTVGTIATITDAEEPMTVDLRTLSFGPASASAVQTATHASGAWSVEFRDSVPFTGDL